MDGWLPWMARTLAPAMLLLTGTLTVLCVVQALTAHTALDTLVASVGALAGAWSFKTWCEMWPVFWRQSGTER